jgi:hypothetical protein
MTLNRNHRYKWYLERDEYPQTGTVQPARRYTTDPTPLSNPPSFGLG